MNSTQEQRNALSILPILWGAMFISSFVYAFVCFNQFGAFLLKEFTNLNDPVSLILVLVALMTFSLSFPLFKILLKQSVKNMPERPTSLENYLKVYMVPFIVKLLLIEATVIYGLVLSFMKDQNLILPFLIVGLVGFFISFPSEDKIKSAFRK